MLKFSKQVFTRPTFGDKFCFLDIYDILEMFSTKLKKQLPWGRPINTLIIWLTKQIKIPKIVKIFLEKFPWWSIVFRNSQGNITEAGL